MPPGEHPTPYATVLSVRKLATFIPTSDLSDSDISPYIESAMDEIDDATGRTGTYWSSTEERFGIVQWITKAKAAAMLIRHYGIKYIGASEAQAAAKALEEEAEAELEELAGEVGGEGAGVDADVPSATTTYSTLEAANMEHPGQTTVKAYRSTGMV